MSQKPAISPRVAVIGAGVAGLACAAALRARGLAPVVFEKSRGLGGRLATRRMPDGRTFDHGAQFVTARSPAFREQLRIARETGTAAPWQPDGGSKPAEGRNPWIVGTPAMNSFVKPWAEGLDLRCNQRVTGLFRETPGWRIETATGPEPEYFDHVACTAPAPQARELLGPLPEAAEALEALEAVSISPCWALMLSFATPWEPGFELWRSESGALGWVARNGSKPGRGRSGDGWVIHASPAWSQDNLEREAREIAPDMLSLLADVLGPGLPPVEETVAHRWRYARTASPLGRPFLSVAEDSLLCGGDWALGARVEFAFESGQAMARRIAGQATGSTAQS